jgi:4-diphosphocytidyl-2-C-methyl-D-erythritol kinase
MLEVRCSTFIFSAKMPISLSPHGFRLRAPAKVNLRLKVLGKRADGFHEIETVMQRIGLWDIIRVELAVKGLEVHCPGFPDLEGEQNLIWQAVRLLEEESNQRLSFRIYLKKRIPLGAGLGGGSSDAAAVLSGINDFLGRPVSARRLTELAGDLGSDIPFFLTRQTSLARGRGEILEPLPDFPVWWYVLVYPGFPLATRWVYQEVKIPLTEKKQYINIKSLKTGLNGPGIDFLENDLEKAVLAHYPLLSRVKEALLAQGSLGALMTGSGSTVFGLWREKKEAVKAFHHLKRSAWGKVFIAPGLP